MLGSIDEVFVRGKKLVQYTGYKHDKDKNHFFLMLFVAYKAPSKNNAARRKVHGTFLLGTFLLEAALREILK